MGLRLAVIGAGWASTLHLEGFKACEDVEAVAIASRTRGKAEEVAGRYGIAHVFDDPRDMLAEARPDIVAIATPPASHPGYVALAAEHGCHVLCDKPTALNAADAEEMVAAVEARGLRHATGFVFRRDPAILRLRELVAEGAIGEVRDLHCRSALGAPVLPMTWLYDVAEGGGALMQHGQHVIDRAQWVLGSEITAVRGELIHDIAEAVVGPKFHNVFEAFGWAARNAAAAAEGGQMAPVTADSGYAFSARFANGVRGHFWESWHGHGPAADQVELYGTEGTLVWTGAGGLTLLRPRQAPEPVEVEGSVAVGTVSGPAAIKAAQEAGHRYWGQVMRAFVADIQGAPHDPYPTLADGWRVQQVVDAVRTSAETGTWERCSPELARGLAHA